jgi:RNA polymerase sigma-70 factor (ECF subfamily)
VPIGQNRVVSGSDSTHWSIIRGAADGRGPDGEAFARHYEPVIRAYLGARWRHTPLEGEVDDAVQSVFVDCFRENGVLDRADSRVGGGFRAFLYGVVRNVALRAERSRGRRRERQVGSGVDIEAVAAREEPLSKVFDRAWARTLLREAGELMARRARESSDGALRRVDLLRLRFVDDLPIREIARRWDEDPDRVHYHYKRAREEFKAALREVVRLHDSGGPVDEECARLLRYVS